MLEKKSRFSGLARNRILEWVGGSQLHVIRVIILIFLCESGVISMIYGLTIKSDLSLSIVLSAHCYILTD